MRTMTRPTYGEGVEIVEEEPDDMRGQVEKPGRVSGSLILHGGGERRQRLSERGGLCHDQVICVVIPRIYRCVSETGWARPPVCQRAVFCTSDEKQIVLTLADYLY